MSSERGMKKGWMLIMCVIVSVSSVAGGITWDNAYAPWIIARLLRKETSVDEIAGISEGTRDKLREAQSLYAEENDNDEDLYNLLDSQRFSENLRSVGLEEISVRGRRGLYNFIDLVREKRKTFEDYAPTTPGTLIPTPASAPASISHFPSSAPASAQTSSSTTVSSSPMSAASMTPAPASSYTAIRPTSTGSASEVTSAPAASPLSAAARPSGAVVIPWKNDYAPWIIARLLRNEMTVDEITGMPENVKNDLRQAQSLYAEENDNDEDLYNLLDSQRFSHDLKDAGFEEISVRGRRGLYNFIDLVREKRKTFEDYAPTTPGTLIPTPASAPASISHFPSSTPASAQTSSSTTVSSSPMSAASTGSASEVTPSYAVHSGLRAAVPISSETFSRKVDDSDRVNAFQAILNGKSLESLTHIHPQIASDNILIAFENAFKKGDKKQITQILTLWDQKPLVEHPAVQNMDDGIWSNKKVRYGTVALAAAVLAYGGYRGYKYYKKRRDAQAKVAAAEAERAAAADAVATPEQLRIVDTAFALVESAQRKSLTPVEYDKVVVAHGCSPDNPLLLAVYEKVLPQLPVESSGSTSQLRLNALMKFGKRVGSGVLAGALAGGLSGAATWNNLRTKSFPFHAQREKRQISRGFGFLMANGDRKSCITGRWGKARWYGFNGAQMGAAISAVIALIMPVIRARNAAETIRRTRMNTRTALLEALINNTPEAGAAALLSYGKVVDAELDVSRSPFGKNVAPLGRGA